MKKVYSFMLMAAALLISANTWGQTTTVQLVNHDDATKSKNYATLQAAIDAIAPGEYGTITLLDEQNLTAQVVIPHVMGEDDATYTARGPVVGRELQHITLNMNGFDINGANNKSCIALVKGELHITGEGTITKNGTYAGNFGSWDRAAIVVGGAAGDKDTPANDHSKEWWSILTIDEHVKLYSAAPKTMGLSVANIGSNTYGDNGNNIDDAAAAWLGTKDKLGYLTYSKTDKRNTMWSYSHLPSDPGSEQGSAFGVKIVVKGEIYGERRGVNVLGHVNQHPSSFPETGTHKETSKRYTIGNEHPYYYEHYFPWITLTSTAKVHCVETGITGDEACGIYSAGWAVLDISGAVYGQNGAYLKGGDLKLNDANVYSTSSVGQNSGMANANCSGNGIFVSTDDSYAHDITIEVNGDSRIAGNGGVAITDVVASVTTTPDVNYITINGGTIEGGTMGAIVVTENTGTNTIAYGGTNISGATTKGGTESSVAATGTYATAVTDTVTNKTTIVISDLGAGNSVETVTENLDQTTEDYVKWTGTDDQYILGDKTLEYLEMNPSPAVDQIIYVGDDTHHATLNVGRVVMGSKAKIIVAPGSSLIVTGVDGIVAPSVDNIVLKTSETAQATFLFNPSVNSNRHPNATVELISKSFYEGGKTVYQRFGIPTYNNNVKLEYKNPASAVQTYITYWDYAIDNWDQGDWIAVPAATGLTIGVSAPFACLELVSNNAKAEKMSYLFKGALVGNDDAAMTFNSQFNPYANSYMAPIDIETFLTRIAEKYPELTASMYVYEALANDNYTWTGVGQADFTGWDTPAFTEIAPMQAYMLYLKPGNTSNATISYKDNVYDPYVSGNANHAPARRGLAMKQNFMKLSIADENGIVFDNTRILEDNQFSEELDNGYDINKFMNENVSIYVTSQNETWHTLATDDIMNAYIGVNVAKSGTYTINVAHNGLDYALVDTENNQIINMVEGNTYSFYQEAGKNDTRFQVVRINKVPTAIDDVQDNDVLSTKLMKDGVLYIIKNGVVYNAQGQIIK